MSIYGVKGYNEIKSNRFTMQFKIWTSLPERNKFINNNVDYFVMGQKNNE